MDRAILFALFVIFSIIGSYFVLKRTGNYDVDLFTKLVGWLLLAPSIWGILELIGI